MRGAFIVAIAGVALWISPVRAEEQQPEASTPPPAAGSATAAQPEAAAPAGSATADAQPEDAGRIARAQFSTEIESREPTDSIETLGNDVSRVYFFTELVDLTGRTVTHRWEKDGVPMAEVEFQVGGPRWRVYSSKDLDPAWVGTWTVTAVDDAGRVLASDTLQYTAVAHPMETTPPADEMAPAEESKPVSPAAPSPIQE